MTKEEYLNTVLLTEDRGWLDRTDICEIASNAWDACSEHWKDKIKAAFYNGHIDPFAAKLLLGDVPHPVDKGREKAKEKH